MADSFSIKFNIYAIPLETVEMTDTTQSLTGVHSSIDRTFGGGMAANCGAVAANVGFVDYATTTGGVLLGSMGFTGLPQGITFIFIKINSAISTGTPDVFISLDAGTPVYSVSLSGVGDCLLIRSSLGSLTGQDILIKSSASAARANISILVGGT